MILLSEYEQKYNYIFVLLTRMESFDIIGSFGKFLSIISESIHENLKKKKFTQTNENVPHYFDVTSINHNDEECQIMKRNVDVWARTFENNEEIAERLKGVWLASNLYEHACITDGVRVKPNTCYNLRRDYFDIYMHTERIIDKLRG